MSYQNTIDGIFEKDAHIDGYKIPKILADKIKNLLISVGHIGVDMGDGQCYDIGTWGIQEAQEIYTDLSDLMMKACEQKNEQPAQVHDISNQLTDVQIYEMLPDRQNGWSDKDYGMWVARAIERAHGIFPSAEPEMKS